MRVVLPVFSLFALAVGACDAYGGRDSPGPVFPVLPDPTTLAPGTFALGTSNLGFAPAGSTGTADSEDDGRYTRVTLLVNGDPGGLRASFGSTELQDALSAPRVGTVTSVGLSFSGYGGGGTVKVAAFTDSTIALTFEGRGVKEALFGLYMAQGSVSGAVNLRRP